MPGWAVQEALDLLAAWCRIRSVRGNGAGLAAQAGAIVDWLRCELRAEVLHVGNAEAPLVHARVDAGAPYTVILYNMFDVMPATPDGWVVDPFAGGYATLDGVGPCFVARGAENNKGPLAGMLLAVKAMASTLPVNVEFLLEGEEESGSTTLRRYLADPGCPVRPARAALFPSFCEYGGGPPRVYLGSSGIAKGRVTVRGGSWGGPRSAIHSSNAPWIANPASRLVQALAAFGRPPTGELAQISLDDEAGTLIDTLAHSFDPRAELRFRDTLRFSREGNARTLLRHLLATASVNISALATEPPDGDAVTPHAASARFDLRAPPGLDPGALLRTLQDVLASRALDGTTLDVADHYPGWRFPAALPGVAALLGAYAETSPLPPQVWPWAPGAAPAYAFAPHAPCFLVGGAGRGGGAHGVDEFLTLEGFGRFIRSVRLWLEACGR